MMDVVVVVVDFDARTGLEQWWWIHSVVDSAGVARCRSADAGRRRTHVAADRRQSDAAHRHRRALSPRRHDQHRWYAQLLACSLVGWHRWRVCFVLLFVVVVGVLIENLLLGSDLTIRKMAKYRHCTASMIDCRQCCSRVATAKRCEAKRLRRRDARTPQRRRRLVRIRSCSTFDPTCRTSTSSSSLTFPRAVRALVDWLASFETTSTIRCRRKSFIKVLIIAIKLVFCVCLFFYH
jgi:hypothetical protein